MWDVYSKRIVSAVSKYHKVKVLIFERNFPIKLNRHSFPDLHLHETFSLFSCELILEGCPSLLDTPCIILYNIFKYTLYNAIQYI